MIYFHTYCSKKLYEKEIKEFNKNPKNISIVGMVILKDLPGVVDLCRRQGWSVV
jgi:hypothetical protein